MPTSPARALAETIATVFKLQQYLVSSRMRVHKQLVMIKEIEDLVKEKRALEIKKSAEKEKYIGLQFFSSALNAEIKAFNEKFRRLNEKRNYNREKYHDENWGDIGNKNFLIQLYTDFKNDFIELQKLWPVLVRQMIFSDRVSTYLAEFLSANDIDKVLSLTLDVYLGGAVHDGEMPLRTTPRSHR